MRTKRLRATAFLTLTALLNLSTSADARKRRAGDQVTVRTINVEVENVFDPDVPGEDRWPFTWANALHIRTRASVIRRQLLMKPGETVNRALFEESERNLRSLSFIKDAKVMEMPAPNGQVDLLVRTQDTWTTQPQINFGSEGGESHFDVGFEEENFLGYGKYVTYFIKDDKDGTSHEVGYRDPQILSTRLTLDTLFRTTPFGSEQHIALARPFYALETRAAAGINFDNVRSLERVVENGIELTRYQLKQTDASVFGGYRINDDLQNIQRLTLRYRYDLDDYRAEALTAPGTLPEDNALAGPTLTWTLEQTDFIKETFIDRAERIEDINLGHQVTVGTGYSGKALGATENSTPITVTEAFGFGGDGPWFGLTSFGINGRYNHRSTGSNGGKPSNTLYFGNFNWYRHMLPEFPLTTVLHLESGYVQNPDAANLLELGGDTGLRGFKAESFTGNKSFLANIEERFFIPYEVFHLAYLGGAVFFDAGQVQPPGQGFNRKDIRANIGAGLRIGLTRSTAGSIYRIDVAYALGKINQGDRIIVSISSGQGFKRDGNTFGKLVGQTQR
jgi:outer membrane protein assembly factor BamA